MTKFNTFWPRIYAALLDAFIFLPFKYLDRSMTNLLSDIQGLLILWTIISLCAFPVYVILMHSEYGWTLGKKWMNIKIVTYPDEMPIGFRESILREFPVLIFLVIHILFVPFSIMFPSINENSVVTTMEGVLGFTSLLWFFIEVGTMVFNPQNRALHDLIAGTVAIRTDQSDTSS